MNAATVLADSGMSRAESELLLREADERGLAEFLDNPQNLLLLRRAVQSGEWPTTRRDLFEMATRLMLQEENSERARTGSGVYTGEELRLPAGAALASRLISDIEAISLADQEGTETIPSYRTLPFFEPGKTIAALGRRVFAAGPMPESVDYVHRTTAQYLGAAWLAQAVRTGLPIGRVVALTMAWTEIGAPELRGLHAWLVVHLSEHAERLIDADPYGVLTYGDAASLISRNACVLFVRSDSYRAPIRGFAAAYGSPAIAGLARADMVDEFRAVLRAPTLASACAASSLRRPRWARPWHHCETILRAYLKRGPCLYEQRLYALMALLRLGVTAGRASCTHAAPYLAQSWRLSAFGQKRSDDFTASRLGLRIWHVSRVRHPLQRGRRGYRHSMEFARASSCPPIFPLFSMRSTRPRAMLTPSAITFGKSQASFNARCCVSEAPDAIDLECLPGYRSA